MKRKFEEEEFEEVSFPRSVISSHSVDEEDDRPEIAKQKKARILKVCCSSLISVIKKIQALDA